MRVKAKAPININIWGGAMRYEVADLIDMVLAKNEWTQRELTNQMGCGKNSLKGWRENGAPYYVVIALEHFGGF